MVSVHLNRAIKVIIMVTLHHAGQEAEVQTTYAGLHSRPLVTNGFEIIVPPSIDLVVREFPNPSEVKAERERLTSFWFVHWMGGKLYQVRLNAGGPNVEGKQISASTASHPQLLRSLLDDAMGTALPKYEALRERPFTFLAQRSELIKAAAEAAGIEHNLLAAFSVTPRFSLNSKIYEPSDGETKIGIFVTVGMQFDISASLSDLQAAGVDITGMYTVRREAILGEKRLAGRITKFTDNNIHLTEATGSEIILESQLKLEGSKENFTRCLSKLLGFKYKRLMDALDEQESAFRTGPKFDEIVNKMGGFLQKNPIILAQDIVATVGERIVLSNTQDTKSVYTAPPVDYVFDRTGAKSAAYAWTGLSQYGPYDRASFSNKSPRILVVYPASTQGKVEAFLNAFRDGMGANFKGFPKGFRDLFGLVSVDFVRCPVEISEGNRNRSKDAYLSTIESKLAEVNDVHGGIVVLFDEHAFLPGLQNPYIQTKALLLTLGIPTQEVRMNTINASPQTLQYSLQNFSVSMYAKLNGTPWTVNHDKAISDELVIGVGFAEMSGSRAKNRQRFVGITTVFSGDGTYLLGNVSKDCEYEGYPDMIRENMLAILRELKKRNNWQPGDLVRVVFHAHRPLKRVDVGRIVFECAREIGNEQDIQMAFVTISQDHPFYLIDRKEAGIPIKRDSNIMKGVYAPARGSIARVGRLTRLLSVNSGKLIKRPNAPLPIPLLVSLHPDSTFKDVDYLAEQALKFTSLSWRSTLPSGSPVTIFYSERIAELLGRLRDIPNWSSSALNVKLRWSRWFL